MHRRESTLEVIVVYRPLRRPGRTTRAGCYRLGGRGSGLVSGRDAVTVAADVDREARRRVLVTGRTDLDGIDFVEVLANRADTPGHVHGAPAQRTLLVHLLNGPVPADWTADRVQHHRRRARRTRGSTRSASSGPIPALAVAGAAQDDDLPTPPPGVTRGRPELVDQALPTARRGRARALVVRTHVERATGRTYTLALARRRRRASAGAGGSTSRSPAAPFSFTVDCPCDLDCAPRPRPPRPRSRRPLPATTWPATTTRCARGCSTGSRRCCRLDGPQPGRPGGDARSSCSPTSATGWPTGRTPSRSRPTSATARRRTSVRRHARLLDYRSTRAARPGPAGRHHGRPPTVDPGPRGTPVTRPAGAATPRPARRATPTDAGAARLRDLRRPSRSAGQRNALPLHAWGDADHCLPAGTTAAFVSTAGRAATRSCAPGDLLVLADQPGASRRTSARRRPGRRYAVRLVARRRGAHRRARAPASRCSRCAGPRGRPARAAAGRASRRRRRRRVRAVALANVVLADHGATVAEEQLVPPRSRPPGAYRPAAAAPRPGRSSTRDRRRRRGAAQRPARAGPTRAGPRPR